MPPDCEAELEKLSECETCFVRRIGSISEPPKIFEYRIMLLALGGRCHGNWRCTMRWRSRRTLELPPRRFTISSSSARIKFMVRAKSAQIARLLSPVRAAFKLNSPASISRSQGKIESFSASGLPRASRGIIVAGSARPSARCCARNHTYWSDLTSRKPSKIVSKGFVEIVHQDPGPILILSNGNIRPSSAALVFSRHQPFERCDQRARSSRSAIHTWSRSTSA